MAKYTTSLWGKPPTRYYKLLRRVEEAIHDRPITMAVLGCADGKFVLPAARRGVQVFAIDVDATALYGGPKPGVGGTVLMPGLAARLGAEELKGLVKVVHDDFVEYSPNQQYHLVLTSGAVQYSRNLKYPMSRLVESLKKYVLPGGFLYIDYMLPWEDKYKGRHICPDRQAWQAYFSSANWKLLYNRSRPPVIDMAHVEYPVNHYHQWGHLLVQKVGELGKDR